MKRWLCDSLLCDGDKTLADARISLKAKTVHITDVVAKLSEGGIHDYYSNADYWWPNPDKPDGLPYIQRDGQTNPENFESHRLILRRCRTHIATLAAAYVLTDEELYAQKAMQFIKEFFFDEQTQMSPHLLYAQAIPGVCSGRGIGIIDTLHLIDVPMAIEALRNSASMTLEDYQGLKGWFQDYLKWMTTHPYGIEERDTQNNHSVCWYVQVAVFGRFTGNQEIVDFCRNQFKRVLVPDQMALDGSFPRELSRTKPYNYSIFILDNLVALCHVLSTEKENLWEFQLPDGRGIRRALEFLYPYLKDKTKWPYTPDVEHFEALPVRVPSLLFAGLGLSDNRFLELWRRLPPDSTDQEIRRNISIRQPLLWLL
ncbi:alginate lyase family protein [Alicyclobacillus fastidiosus]|uniref:Alginate lyase family protein n=1 Tax=Alicyclobacillus fastidiosus TaxID=392011 RepID=A0ABY6ZCE0_9BACL|nr:alginate lyase family protein [Alicyclobacillus fastidiosus]WAH39869.1 alginate lyase family protein [Alicyclobacillus fastidiosus]GMA61136.1 hypothetical protein GCM10025859_15760 [Alicyclobacillus fastidiosus]